MLSSRGDRSKHTVPCVRSMQGPGHRCQGSPEEVVDEDTLRRRAIVLGFRDEKEGKEKSDNDIPGERNTMVYARAPEKKGQGFMIKK